MRVTLARREAAGSQLVLVILDRHDDRFGLRCREGAGDRHRTLQGQVHVAVAIHEPERVKILSRPSSPERSAIRCSSSSGMQR